MELTQCPGEQPAENRQQNSETETVDGQQLVVCGIQGIIVSVLDFLDHTWNEIHPFSGPGCKKDMNKLVKLQWSYYSVKKRQLQLMELFWSGEGLWKS